MTSNSKPSGSPGEVSASDTVLVPLRRALLDHYDRNQRRLPWRGETDPYRILVSEIMLQQTRVETVLQYYGAWLGRFPNLESLADADLDDVLETWEGLGYYRRARNLHRAARLVRERLDGELPRTFAELKELPGVGEYTAGAVASIAFGESVPAPDGNVRRVLARVFDVADPKPTWLRDAAATLVDPGRPGDWNQALMELGATICTPKRPDCGRCALAGWCAALHAGTQDERPAPRTRPKPRKVILATAVLVRGGRLLLVRRPPDGLLGGMWAFPEAEVAAAEEARAAVGRLARSHGARPVAQPEPLPSCEHRFTHIQATYLPYVVDAQHESGDGRAAVEGSTWADPEHPVGFALPVAQRRILESARGRLATGGASSDQSSSPPIGSKPW